MTQLVRALALALVLAVPFAARATASTSGPAETAEPASAVAAPAGSAFEWFIVGACLCISFCAGGYTLFCYLRRRDALSTLERMEARYRAAAEASGFDRGPSE